MKPQITQIAQMTEGIGVGCDWRQGLSLTIDGLDPDPTLPSNL